MQDATNKDLQLFFFFLLLIWKYLSKKKKATALNIEYVIERKIWHTPLLNTEQVTLWTAKWCLFQNVDVACALITIQLVNGRRFFDSWQGLLHCLQD